MKDVERQLKALYPNPDTISKIEEKIKAHSKKSPREGFLKAKAYDWLKCQFKCMRASNPTAQKGFSHRDVAVAHKIFKMRGNLQTFQKYLDNPSRKGKLHNAPVCV